MGPRVMFEERKGYEVSSRNSDMLSHLIKPIASFNLNFPKLVINCIKFRCHTKILKQDLKPKRNLAVHTISCGPINTITLIVVYCTNGLKKQT